MSEAPVSTRLCSGCERPPRTSRGFRYSCTPAQDLQIDTRISRTQYQYILEAIDPSELATWAPKLLAKMKEIPRCRMWPAISSRMDCS